MMSTTTVAAANKMIAFLTLFFYMTSLTMCYQRLSVNNNNHNNLDQKPTHLPPLHYPHGHRWNEPYFDLTMPKNITSLVGKSAYLGCRVKHLGNKTVAWIRHRDLHILTVGTYTYTTDQRFQTSYHRDIDEWTLQIKWAQQRDAGVYECQISTQPVRSFSVNLNIVDTIDDEQSNLLQQYYNDDAFYISSDRVYQSSDDEFAGMFGPIQTVAVPTATILGGPDLYVDKGSTINLTCVIKFSPEPPTHIFWYHQDKVLSEETSGGRLKFKTIKSEETKSILLIDDADLIDSGKYSCYPSNTEIASIRVHVLQGERPEAMQTNSAPTTLHSAAVTQPAKVISAIVGAFLLLQILTFLSKKQLQQHIVIIVSVGNSGGGGGRGRGSGCGAGVDVVQHSGNSCHSVKCVQCKKSKGEKSRNVATVTTMPSATELTTANIAPTSAILTSATPKTLSTTAFVAASNLYTLDVATDDHHNKIAANRAIAINCAAAVDVGILKDIAADSIQASAKHIHLDFLCERTIFNPTTTKTIATISSQQQQPEWNQRLVAR